jgi:hypothetical protein
MPQEIASLEEFNTLLPSAIEVRRKLLPNSDFVKLKIRTKKTLYTYKCPSKQVEKIWNALKIEKHDV